MYPYQPQYQQPQPNGYPYQGYPAQTQQPYGQQFYPQQQPAQQYYGQQPPAKRHKTGPIVTRYPPPQHGASASMSHIPYGSYQQSMPGYGTTAPPPNPGYAASQQFQRSFQQVQPTNTAYGYPQQYAWQQSHAVSTAWTPSQPHAHAQYAPPAQPNTQTQYAPPTQSTTQTPAFQPSYSRPATVTQAPPSQAQTSSTYVQSSVPQKRKASTPMIGPQPPKPEQAIQDLGKDYRFSEEYAFEIDFEGDTGFTTESEQPELSLGVIHIRMALPNRVPLAATFKEAELEVIAPSKPPSEGEPVSRYFGKDRLHMLELNVKQTDEWEKVKNDLIFVEFPSHSRFIPLQELKRDRMRPDTQGIDRAQDMEDTALKTSVEDTAQVQVQEEREDEPDNGDDEAMDMASDDEQEPSEPVNGDPAPSNEFSVLDNLEQALNAKDDSRTTYKAAEPLQKNRKVVAFGNPESVNTVQGDEAQERILAALGVEGLPKASVGPMNDHERTMPVDGYLAGPHSGSIRDTISNSHTDLRGNTLQAAYGPNNLPPPPTEEPRTSPTDDPWRKYDSSRPIGDSPRSATSQHTAAGSDFHPDDHDSIPRVLSPKPAAKRLFSGRKRPFEEDGPSDGDGRRRQQADKPKKRRPPPKVSEAYSRRW